MTKLKKTLEEDVGNVYKIKMNIFESTYWTIYYKIENFLYEIKLAYQRVVRGYDDTAKWNLESYLAELINDITLEMAEECSGYPHGLTEKKWRQILKDISFGFGSYIEMRSGVYDFNDKEYKRLEKEYNKGMKLFAKYHPNLWD